MRLRERFEKTKTAPLRGSSPSWPVTSAWRLSKDFLMSHGSSARKTRRLPERVSTGGWR